MRSQRLVRFHGSRKCDRVAVKPTQTKNQLRIIKVMQLYNTPSDVQTQHENFLQHFSGAHVEKMLRFYRPSRMVCTHLVWTGQAA